MISALCQISKMLSRKNRRIRNVCFSSLVMNFVNDSIISECQVTKKKIKLGGRKFISFPFLPAILIFYLKDKLDLTENNATVIYHAFLMMICFTCTLGAIISDVWLGKFRTILYFSILYVIGSIIVSIGAIPGIRISPEIALYIGLTLIAFGAGGIKPCVSPFGGDQFKLPEQSAQLTTYFSMFYFAFYASALISSSITPILRSDVHCFGSNDCYSLAFGVPALLMIISIRKLSLRFSRENNLRSKKFF